MNNEQLHIPKYLFGYLPVDLEQGAWKILKNNFLPNAEWSGVQIGDPSIRLNIGPECLQRMRNVENDSNNPEWQRLMALLGLSGSWLDQENLKLAWRNTIDFKNGDPVSVERMLDLWDHNARYVGISMHASYDRHKQSFYLYAPTQPGLMLQGKSDAFLTYTALEHYAILRYSGFVGEYNFNSKTTRLRGSDNDQRAAYTKMDEITRNFLGMGGGRRLWLQRGFDMGQHLLASTKGVISMPARR